MFKVSYDITPTHMLDAVIRYSGKLSNPDVPSYTSMDVRYGWKLHPDVELSVIGQNLLDSEHPEFSAVNARAEYDRGLFARVQWYFR
jgi:iron complex outermembrane receptor protein